MILIKIHRNGGRGPLARLTPKSAKEGQQQLLC